MWQDVTLLHVSLMRRANVTHTEREIRVQTSICHTFGPASAGANRRCAGIPFQQEAYTELAVRGNVRDGRRTDEHPYGGVAGQQDLTVQ